MRRGRALYHFGLRQTRDSRLMAQRVRLRAEGSKQRSSSLRGAISFRVYRDGKHAHNASSSKASSVTLCTERPDAASSLRGSEWEGFSPNPLHNHVRYGIARVAV